MRVVYIIDTVDDNKLTMPIEERLGVEALVVVIMNFDSDSIKKYDEILSAFVVEVLILARQRSWIWILRI